MLSRHILMSFVIFSTINAQSCSKKDKKVHSPHVVQEEEKETQNEKTPESPTLADESTVIQESSKDSENKSEIPQQVQVLVDKDQDKFEFVSIPAGKFWMGSSIVEKGRGDDETRHEVVITKSYKMMKHEVSQAQYIAVMGESENHSAFVGDNLPVESLSWLDVQRFIAKLNEGIEKCGDTSTSQGFKKAYVTSGCYRLPTEAEWEYAARGGVDKPFYTGDNLTAEQANFDGRFSYVETSEEIFVERTLPVDHKMIDASHPFGLEHILGNVGEWTQDRYGRYASKQQQDPMGVVNGDERVYRGGSWRDSAQYSRSAKRSSNPSNGRYYKIGFRLVRTL